MPPTRINLADGIRCTIQTSQQTCRSRRRPPPSQEHMFTQLIWHEPPTINRLKTCLPRDKPQEFLFSGTPNGNYNGASCNTRPPGCKRVSGMWLTICQGKNLGLGYCMEVSAWIVPMSPCFCRLQLFCFSFNYFVLFVYLDGFRLQRDTKTDKF